MCQKWGVKKRGYWRKLRVPDWRHWGEGHHWWFFLHKEVTLKVCIDMSIRSVSGMGGREGVLGGHLGVKKWGTWRMLRVHDRRHGGQGHPWCHGWCFFTLRKIPWKFCANIFIISLSGMGGQEVGYLEDVEGSWSETWKLGSSLTSLMIFFYPKEDTLNILCLYHN